MRVIGGRYSRGFEEGVVLCSVAGDFTWELHFLIMRILKVSDGERASLVCRFDYGVCGAHYWNMERFRNIT